jgi:hypothetical protein
MHQFIALDSTVALMHTMGLESPFPWKKAGTNLDCDSVSGLIVGSFTEKEESSITEWRYHLSGPSTNSHVQQTCRTIYLLVNSFSFSFSSKGWAAFKIKLSET